MVMMDVLWIENIQIVLYVNCCHSVSNLLYAIELLPPNGLSLANSRKTISLFLSLYLRSIETQSMVTIQNSQWILDSRLTPFWVMLMTTLQIKAGSTGVRCTTIFSISASGYLTYPM